MNLGNLIFYIYSCVRVVCLHAYFCAMCMSSAHRSQKRALTLWGLVVQMVVSPDLGAGN